MKIKIKKNTQILALFSILLVFILVVLFIFRRSLLNMVSICDLGETKFTLTNEEKFTYRNTQLISDILIHPTLAVRFYEFGGSNNSLSWFKDISGDVKSVGDERLTIRPLNIKEDKVIVCLSPAEKGLFKKLTSEESVNKYLPPYSTSEIDDFFKTTVDTNSQKYVNYKFDTLSFSYLKSLYLLKKDNVVWLSNQKMSEREVEAFPWNWVSPRTYMTISIVSNPQDFTAKQFYLYSSGGPRFVNGDMESNQDTFYRNSMISLIKLPNNLKNLDTYSWTNGTTGRVYIKVNDRMIVIEAVPLTDYVDVISSLKISN